MIHSVFGQKSESEMVRLVRLPVSYSASIEVKKVEYTSHLQHICCLIASREICMQCLGVTVLLSYSMMLEQCTTFHHLLKSFVTEVWQTPNQLLRAVLADVRVPEYKAGCKALGIVNKVITGPLWRVLESQDMSILKMNEKFHQLTSCLEIWSEDASGVVSGEAILFSIFLLTKDQIYESLFTTSVYDATAWEILEVLFGAFSTLVYVSRLVEDQLPDGKHGNPSVELITETKSVPTTNVISERNFANLDRFLREKPNASTLSLEAMIMLSNNKTAA